MIGRRIALAFALVLVLAPAAAPAPVDAVYETGSPIPMLAYYYIWFEPESWERAKIDYPILGRYSSDDRDVMRQHIRWAKAAGIDGFIVSWKSTLTLDRRLEMLMDVAHSESFKLAIMYQGLDFNRNPLPVERIAADIDHFISTYAGDPVFDIFGGPMVIWSGTWEYTPEQIASVSTTRGLRSGCEWRSDLEPRCVLLLATERNVDGVRRLEGKVDGNAYYWSSVNPQSFPGHLDKLSAMADAVHETNGFWIAPAAPGFDARLVGGTTVVQRLDGDTLRQELDVAYASSPDAIGLISWNEFSENSHVEPSEQHGTNSLDVLADVEGGRPPVLPELDSSQPDLAPVGGGREEGVGRVVALSLLVGAIGVGSIVIARRQRSGRAPPARPG
ncbi:MAG: endo-1,3-alpha-glucanase family glycosylhydrolase [Candidatus Limnocylindria bacterium]